MPKFRAEAAPSADRVPLTEGEWKRPKAAVEGMFRDVAQTVSRLEVEAEALRRISQGGDVRGVLGAILEATAETNLDELARIRRRLTLFGRDVEDIRGGGEL